MALEHGLIHVYTGDGKGKTTAAFGLAVRAAGQGLRVKIIQFMKGNINYGEIQSVKKLPTIEVEQFGRETFVDPDNPDDEDIALANKALDYAGALIADGAYDLVILDEINVAISFGLIDMKRVLDVLLTRPENVEVVLTGRYAPDELINVADLVTEMKEIKHPYKKRIEARKGIEY